MINKKVLGLILVVISIIQFVVFHNIVENTKEAISEKIISESEGICEHVGNECPHEELSSLDPYIFLGYAAIGVVFIIGNILMLQKKKKTINYEIPSNLSDEEKKIVELLKGSEGSAFQSELVDQTGFTKVKITRVLDRLEGRGIIERRRRGMTNIVILKRN